MELVLETKQLARILKVRGPTLEKWRKNGKGPKYHHVGSRVRYFWPEVLEWLGIDVEVWPSDKQGMDALAKALEESVKRKK
jgi:hypothetical protein